MKKQIESTKAFLVKHKDRILITTTVLSTAAVVGMKIGLNQHDDFLKEHDLYDAFYNPEEEALEV